MRTVADLQTDVSPEELFAAVDTLDGYDEWLDIVARVVEAEPDEGDAGPAWLVDLRGQVGPLRRSKRLRMVRSGHNPPGRSGEGSVRYERRELDGRSHSTWVLTARISPGEPSGSSLEMTLHYGGSLWLPLLERMLREEIERSGPRLLEHLRAR